MSKILCRKRADHRHVLSVFFFILSVCKSGAWNCCISLVLNLLHLDKLNIRHQLLTSTHRCMCFKP